MTIVVNAPRSWAAPYSEEAVPVTLEEGLTVDDEEIGNSLLLETLVVAEPPPPDPEDAIAAGLSSQHYPFNRALGLSLGLFNSSSQPSGLNFAIGVNYWWEAVRDRYMLEGGVHLISDQGGLFYFNQRFPFMARNAFRPFVRFGGGLVFSGGEGLGTFIQWQNYHLNIGGGGEYWLVGSSSLRFDFDLIYRLKSELIVGFTAGYNWAW